MTEPEWLDAGSVKSLVDFLDREAVTLVDRVPPERREVVRRHLLTLTSDRKRRLLACSFARQVWPLLTDPRSRNAVEVAERFADGMIDDGELAAAVTAAVRARDEVRIDRRIGGFRATQVVRPAATAAVLAARFDLLAAAEECGVVATLGSLCPTLIDSERMQAALVRDIMGNPFRPPPDIDPAWRAFSGGAVVDLAWVIDAERRFEDMPVLADALEEAGCHDETLLGHLRGSWPHARGCHILDHILGKK